MVTADEEGEREEGEGDAMAVPSAGETKVAAALAVGAYFSAIVPLLKPRQCSTAEQLNRI
jgi:hypothetical protein